MISNFSVDNLLQNLILALPVSIKQLKGMLEIIWLQLPVQQLRGEFHKPSLRYLRLLSGKTQVVELRKMAAIGKGIALPQSRRWIHIFL